MTKTNNTVKILSIVITVFMVIGVFGAALTASAAEASPITYTEIEGGLEVSACDRAAEGIIEVPAEIDGKPVISIGAWGFANCANVTEIILPDSIANIGNWAFLNDKALVSFKLPASLTSTGKGIFRACVSLAEVEIPEGLTSLADLTFEGTAIREIAIPDSVSEISSTALPADVTILCTSDSFAHAYATENNIPHIINDVFYVSFVADGEEIAKAPFTFAKGVPSIEYPAVPVKAGYTGIWGPLTLNESDTTVEAQYKATTNFATFIAGDEIVAEIPFTVENSSIEEPEIPQREGYTARWQSYTLGKDSVSVQAIYTPIEYEAVFMADGVVAGRVIYNINTTSIAVPDVPEKEGYFGTWEAFALESGGVEIEAEYIKIEANSIYITAAKNTVEAGETVKLSAEIIPFDAFNQTVVWESSDESIVTVEADPDNSLVCYVENVGEGDAVITVTVLDEEGNPTEIAGSLEITANEFSIASTATNRIQGFFARIVSFIASIASFSAALANR